MSHGIDAKLISIGKLTRIRDLDQLYFGTARTLTYTPIRFCFVVLLCSFRKLKKKELNVSYVVTFNVSEFFSCYTLSLAIWTSGTVFANIGDFAFFD